MVLITGKLEIVQVLLDARVDDDYIDEPSQTALFLAAEGEHPEVVGLFLKAGVHVDHLDRKGQTVLT